MNPFIPSLNINSIFSKNNYDKDSEENDIFFSTTEKKEDLINTKEKPDLNRISNLKDNELPLEDKLQIQKQINDDNDNDNDDQIEVIENILNNFDNFGKEKFREKKFLMYKYKSSLKKKYKSNSVINRSNNKILNKIKNDIALINFQQEINKIHKLHNYKIFLKSERAHLNTIKKNNMEKNNINQENKNKKRIEEIKKKLFEQKNKESKPNNIKGLINNFNLNRKKENFLHSKNEKAFKQILEEINNLKQSKINNNNYNNNSNNVCNTFRSGINPLIKSLKQKNFLDDNEDYLKTEESTKTSSPYSNQFFYNVYKNSINKYPYLHILKNKINKMKKFDLSQSQKMFQVRNRTNNKITLLEKINSQKDIFQKEIEKYNSK